MRIAYAIKRGNKWLQGVKANEKYCCSATAPTMGNRYDYSEYKTIWGDDQKTFEPLTAAGYVKTVFEEYRWVDKTAMKITIIPVVLEG
ncbi:MAG: hypothetical protein SOX74_04825 [Candidatus Faecousia sp.]|uniref:hypothetical protein n=1 Tax=Faecousia sp. TaxID=2952921 RepID=UPI002A8BDE99|nr:hypothetical protein [Candidatus Faecousia sp.]